MKLSLWQIFAILTWLAVSLSFAVAIQLPISIRTSIPMLLTGIILTFGRLIFPRPPDREYIENEAFLQKLSDLLILGIPSFLLYFVGVSILTFNILVGFICSSFAFAIYVLHVFAK